MAGKTIEYRETIKAINDRSRLNRRVENDLSILRTHQYFGSAPESIYAIFGRDLSRNSFHMKNYMMDYIDENQDYFENTFSESLKKRGTDLRTWLRCTANEKHRGDEMSVFAMSLLCNVHCAIFLRDEILVTCTESEPLDLPSVITQCSVLVAYFGMDGFRQLVPQTAPLERVRMRQLLNNSSNSDIALNITSGSIQTRSRSKVVSPISSPSRETIRTVTRPSYSPEYPPMDERYTFKTNATLKRKRRPSPVPSPYKKKKKNEQSCMLKFITYGIPKRRKNRHKVCPVKSCGKEFNSIQDFNNHTKRNHNLRYVCYTCGKVYTIKASLDRHKYIHKQILFKCDKCNKEFAFRPDLLDHRVSHHRKGYYHCMFPKCKCVYKRKQDLNRHNKQHSDNIRKCAQCPYYTKCERYLKEHMQQHTHPSRYNCELCKIKFNYRMQLKRHMEKQHPTE